MDARFPTLSRRDISHGLLDDLLHKKLFGFVVPNFISREGINHLLGKIKSGDLKSAHKVAEEFKKIGPVFTEVTSDSARQEYHSVATGYIDQIRGLAYPYLSPIDEVRLLLEERWCWGARLLQDVDRKFFVGTCRYLEPGVDLAPHIDHISRNLHRDGSLVIAGQLAVIAYLDVPEQGGELELWDRFPGRDDYRAMMGDRVYGVDRTSLPPPDLVIRPRAGDLAVIHSEVLHAVRPSQATDRISMGMWVGYESSDKPLFYWS